ncbi:MAG: hypothetical protein J3Q66DRAFT_444766 [Benniella sp.]|nr:MAG: hypothetical protein J3Q66DRAFT_444766 [Benniella sp.]
MRATAIATTAILWLGGIASTALLPIVNASVTCKGGDVSAHFTPRVKLLTGSIQITAAGYLGVCRSEESPNIKGGFYHFSGSGTGACIGPFAVGSGTLQITWSDGSTTTVPQINFRAEATSWSIEGVLEGKSVRANGKPSTPASKMTTRCLTSGLEDYASLIDSFVIE